VQFDTCGRSTQGVNATPHGQQKDGRRCEKGVGHCLGLVMGAPGGRIRRASRQTFLHQTSARRGLLALRATSVRKGGNRRPVKADPLHTWRRGLIKAAPAIFCRTRFFKKEKVRRRKLLAAALGASDQLVCDPAPSNPGVDQLVRNYPVRGRCWQQVLRPPHETTRHTRRNRCSPMTRLVPEVSYPAGASCVLSSSAG
jgi:hypothetical protein